MKELSWLLNARQETLIYIEPLASRRVFRDVCVCLGLSWGITVILPFSWTFLSFFETVVCVFGWMSFHGYLCISLTFLLCIIVSLQFRHWMCICAFVSKRYVLRFQFGLHSIQCIQYLHPGHDCWRRRRGWCTEEIHFPCTTPLDWIVCVFLMHLYIVQYILHPVLCTLSFILSVFLYSHFSQHV